MAYTIDKHDIKLLQKLAAEGPSFMKHIRHEFRAAEMRREGYVSGEMAIYSYHANGNTTFRTRYTITDKGSALLPSEVKP